MSDRVGMCPNIGNCSIADSRQHAKLDADGTGKCPECGRFLIAIANTGGGKKASGGSGLPRNMIAIAAGVLVLALVGVGALVFSGKESVAPSAPQVQNPSAPQVQNPSAAGKALPPQDQASLPSAKPTAPEAKTVLVVAGSNTVGSVLGPGWAELLLQQKGYRDVRVDVTGENEKRISGIAPTTGERQSIIVRAHGSSTAFKDLASGAAELGMASRPVNDKEVEILTGSLGDMRSSSNEHVVALDGVAVVVHRSNPISRLSVSQVADLFSGKAKNWSDLGGPNRPVTIYARDDKSGTYDTFVTLVLGPQKLKLVESAQRFEDSAQLASAVAADPSGIGFIGLPYIGQTKALAISDGDGGAFIPNRFTVATEDYPLARRLFLYTASAPKNPWVMDLVGAAKSADGQEVTAKTGFVNLTIEAVAAKAGESAPDEYRRLTANATRLSVNFRFRPNSSILDNKGLGDLDRVVEFVARSNQRRPSLHLFGFTDNSGSPEANVSLSRSRAEAVAQELRQRGISPDKVLGFGPALPVAANDQPDGRDKNRRVEVWLGNN